ncbi:MAG: HprK-related kinase A [Sphingomonadales bacterium]|nr:HprK-related kinase A [Sphingomonadales bacterium]MBK9268195.1 HprK-related kinase A [Sphingomonadales bacterium]MBP6434772.1 HprK-related kinase A [Sphingorhabdus sp.]
MHEFRVQVGPAAFRIGSAWRAPIAQMAELYRDYPHPDFTDFTVRLEPAGWLRRWLRPSVAIGGDYMLPDAAPLPLAQGLLAAEMAMNLQMALGWRRHLLLHASAVERDGRVLVMTGQSGSGKSTLSALLGARGWRFMGDEFVLLDPESGDAVPFPRLISLKNSAIAAMQASAPDARFGPLLDGTPKGDIRHMVPPSDAIARMGQGGAPALLLFPRYGYPGAVREVAPGETFMRLTQASTNYVALGEAGFTALTRFVTSVPSRAIDYQSGEEAVALVEKLWERLA